MFANVSRWGGRLIRFARFLPIRWRRIREFATTIGLRGAVEFELVRFWSQRRRSGLWRVHVRGWPRPIVGRYETSDAAVFLQIFHEQEHAPTAALVRRERGDNFLILDCGANAGYASIFFLMHFNECCRQMNSLYQNFFSELSFFFKSIVSDKNNIPCKT